MVIGNMPDGGDRLIDARNRRFFWLDNEVVDEFIETVPKKRRADALAVYSVLARHADREGVAWPGLGYIGSKVGRSRPTVISSIDELVDAKLVERIPRSDGQGRKLSNSYRLLDARKSDPGDVNSFYTEEPARTNSSLHPSDVNPVNTKNTPM